MRAFSSPDTTARARASGVQAERMARAAFGPTPETPNSIRKLSSSLEEENP